MAPVERQPTNHSDDDDNDSDYVPPTDTREQSSLDDQAEEQNASGTESPDRRRAVKRPRMDGDQEDRVRIEGDGEEEYRQQ